MLVLMGSNFILGAESGVALMWSFQATVVHGVSLPFDLAKMH